MTLRGDELRRALQRRRDRAPGPAVGCGAAGAERGQARRPPGARARRGSARARRRPPGGRSALTPLDRPNVRSPSGGGPGDAGHAGRVAQRGDDAASSVAVDAGRRRPTTMSAAAHCPAVTVTAVVPQKTTSAMAIVSVSSGTRVPAVRPARAVATTGTSPRRRAASPDRARSVGRQHAGDQHGRGAPRAAPGSPRAAGRRRRWRSAASPRPRTDTRAATAIATRASSAVSRRDAAATEHALAVGPVGGQPSPGPRAGHHDRGGDGGRQRGDQRRSPRRRPRSRGGPARSARRRGTHDGGEGDERHALDQRTQGDRRRPTPRGHARRAGTSRAAPPAAGRPGRA